MALKKINPSILVRLIAFSLIIFSIVVTYYVMVVKKDYEILTNPDGPDKSDYYE